MDFSKMKDRLVSHRDLAEQQISYIREHPDMNAEELHRHIYQYVLYKYNLPGEIQHIYRLDDLAQMSVARASKLPKNQAFSLDNLSACDGATSAMNKKVLLLLAIQRELDIKFPREITAGITSTQKLSDAVLVELQKKQEEYND